MADERVEPIDELQPEAEQLQEEVPPPQKPLIRVMVSSDRLLAEIEFQETAAETLNPEAQDIIEALNEKNVSYGINSEYIKRMTLQPVFGQRMPIANGVAPTTGKDGYLKYLVERKTVLKPKEREDGTVDYRDLGLIDNVRKGQALCEVHPPEKGEDGCDVLGNVLEGIYGKTVSAPAGRNTEFDEEKGIVTAGVDGDVQILPDGMIQIQDVLKIKGNVDNATGDIRFVGDVIIGGDVVSGFKVDSEGSINIRGNVEGAVLTAKYDIIVGGGVNGMDRATLTAGGGIKSKYIQNARLRSGGDIVADSIMYCNVECGGNMVLSGKRGALIGGHTIVANELSAHTIGTDSHAATHISMAAPKYNEEIKSLKKEIHALDTELISLIQTMTWCEDLSKKGKLKPFHVNAFNQARARQIALMPEREEKRVALEKAQDDLLRIDPATCLIKCSGRVHAGVRIAFGPLTMTVQTSFVNSRVTVVDGDIAVMPM